MKKAIIIVSACMFAISLFAVSAFAVSGTKFNAKVKSVDATKMEMVVTPSGSKEDMTIKVDKAAIDKKFKAGTVVSVILDKEGGNVAKKVHKALTVPVGC